MMPGVAKETLGDRIKRLRAERGMSLAKVSGADFSRAFLNQVELGKSQPSTRVLRVIAGRLDTHVDYLLEGRLPSLDRELALERARVLLAKDDPRRALAAVEAVADLKDWPLGTDARLCKAEALQALGRTKDAAALLAAEAKTIALHKDSHRKARLRALRQGKRVSVSAPLHLKLADKALRAGNSADALEHYRAARVLLES